MPETPFVPAPLDRPPQLRARRLFRSPGLMALAASSALAVSAIVGGPGLVALADADAIVEMADEDASALDAIVLRFDDDAAAVGTVPLDPPVDL
jgi:hypothetical protein